MLKGEACRWPRTRPDWWLGFWDDSKSPYEQPAMGRLFNINEKWPYPLKPTDYVRRQFHIQFADDPVAVGGTLAKVAGFDASKKLAVERRAAGTAAS